MKIKSKVSIKQILLSLCIILLISGIGYSQSQDTTISKDTTISQSTTKSMKELQKITPPVKIDVPGQHFSLSTGRLYVPDFFQKSSTGEFDLVVFFHGAAWCSEQVYYEGRKNAPILSISLGDYEKAFKDTTCFQRLLDEAVLTLDTSNIIPHAKLNRICIASFSGGYSAPREILKTPAYFNKISDLVLADSLYCGNNPENPTLLNDVQMEPFLNFAMYAAEGKKTFWFTQLYPPEEKYRDNGTTRTAAYLMEHLQGQKVERHDVNRRGMTVLYSCDKGNFHIRGYAGMYNQDHFNHLYNLGEYYSKISFDSVK